MARPRKPITVGVVITVALAAVGWGVTTGSRLSAVETQAASTEDHLRRHEAAEATILHEIRQTNRDIDQRLSRIEGRLDEMRRGK